MYLPSSRLIVAPRTPVLLPPACVKTTLCAACTGQPNPSFTVTVSVVVTPDGNVSRFTGLCASVLSLIVRFETLKSIGPGVHAGPTVIVGAGVVTDRPSSVA